MTLDMPGTLTIGLLMPLVLLVALILGAAAQWALRGRVKLAASPLIVLTILSVSVDMLILGWLFPWVHPFSVIGLLTALGACAAALVAYAGVAAHFQRPVAPAPIAELMSAGESNRVEFKSSARWNLHTGARDDKMELVIAKTVAGFLNSDGGTLLIGVDDDGHAVGLVHDFSTVKAPDTDRYELWLRDFLTSTLGQNASVLPVIDFAPVTVDGAATYVCRVTCPASPRPVYLRASKSGGSELWVRTGNSTRLLKVDEAIDYVMHRWPLSLGSTAAAQLRAAARFSGA